MWVKRVLRLLPDLKRILLTAIGLSLFIECLKIVPPYLMKIAVDMLIAPSPVLFEVFWVIGGVLVASLLTTLFEDKFVLFTANSIFQSEAEILNKGQDKLLSLGMRYHEANPSGQLVHLMNKGSHRLAELLWFVQDQFIGAILQIILTSIILVWVHFWCGMVFVIFMPIVIFLIHRTAKKVQPYRQQYHAKFRVATWEMNQSLVNVRTVKDYVQEAAERGKYQRLLKEYEDLARIRIEFENRDLRTRDITLGIARFTVLFYAVYLVYIGDMTAGTLVLFATLSEKVIASLYRLGRLYSHLGDAMESIDQFTELFEQEPDIVDGSDAIDCPEIEGRVTFEDVDFQYNPTVPVLNDIDFEIPAKKVVAFVGRSGCGKTTMIKLINRHYDPTQGVIRIDGIDIKDIKVDQYRRQTSVVSQDIEIFDTTVAKNISYGRSDVSMEEVERVARLANAHEFIETLPDQYETIVGERGLKLSGGQKQRVGIARALIMEPAVLIFDEATSSLDTESERLIQEALKEIAHKQTMIIIAHRLSTIESADLIVVFEEGRIIEVDSYSNLMKKEGVFAKMRKLQQLGEIRE